jgi:hypothetical protein
MRQEPIAYINVEQRKLEFAKPIMWHTPTVVNLERIPLYTHQRTWVGLASEDRLTAKYMQDAPDGIEAVIDYIEAKLKEKNS